MVRWRLRFNLQEIDLRPGKVMLGRAAECPISIEDPLVSRHHAEIVVTATGAVLRDLDSRNGVRVNGVKITQPHELQPNDRVRLGRDEIVILTSENSGAYRPTRPTGRQDSCERCGHEHASGVSICSHCGEAITAALFGHFQPVAARTSGAS